jgi:hypothetical protein
VFVDADGTVLYGQDCSISIMTHDNVLVVPPGDSGLCGMAAQNVAQLALQVSGLVGNGMIELMFHQAACLTTDQ